MPTKTGKTGVGRCARCGEDHEAIQWFRITRPIEDTDGTVWDEWGACPTTGEPILCRRTPTE